MTLLKNKTLLEKSIIIMWLIMFATAPFTQKVMRYGFYLPMLLTFYYCRGDIEYGFKKNIVGKLLLLFLLFTLLSSLFSQDPTPNVSRWFRYFTYVLLYFSIHYLVRRKALSEPLMWSIVLYGVVFAAGNIAFLLDFNLKLRQHGYTDNCVIFGHLSSIAFISVLAFINEYRPHGSIRDILTISTPVLLALLISSQSRGAILGLCTALIFYYYLKQLHRRWHSLAILVTLFVIMLLLTPTLMAEIRSATELFSPRNKIWLDSLSFFKENPLWGIGLVKYSDYTRAHGIFPEMNAHNLFLQFLATAGIFSFLTWVLAIFTTLYLGAKKVLKTEALKNEHSNVLLTVSLVMLAAYIGNGMVEFGIEQGHVGSIFFISMGIVSGLAIEPFQKTPVTR